MEAAPTACRCTAPAVPAVRIVRVADVAPQPWRNGGGRTRELLAWPSPGGWSVRVSVADIACDGPFSPFPGVERWFAVIDGPGVVLRLGGRDRMQRRGDPPLVFDGAAAPPCRLVDGPTRDLNLMLRGARGGLRPIEDGVRWAPDAAACGLFAAVAGRCAVERATTAGAASLALAADTLVWFDAAPAALRFDAGRDVGPRAGAGAPAVLAGWWIAATPVDGGSR